MRKFVFILSVFIISFCFNFRLVNADTYSAGYLFVDNLNTGYTSNSSWIFRNNVEPIRNNVATFDFYLNQSLNNYQSADYFIFNIQTALDTGFDYDGKGYIDCYKENSSFCTGYTLTYDKMSIDVSFQYHPKSSSGSWGPVGKCEFLQIGDTLSTVKCPNVSKDTDFSQAVFTFQIFFNSSLATNFSLNLGVSREYNSIVLTSTEISESQQQTNEKLDETNEQLTDLNDNITNSDVSGAQSDADNFFSGFENDSHGLTAIVTAPLNLIQSITSSTCTPIGFDAPFVGQQVTLPCMKDVYEDHFGFFLTLYQTITFGVVAYWVCVNILATVRGFKDPDSDKIEVLDL